MSNVHSHRVDGRAASDEREKVGVLVVGRGLWARALGVALHRRAGLHTVAVSPTASVSDALLPQVSLVLADWCHTDRASTDIPRMIAALRPRAAAVVITPDDQAVRRDVVAAGALGVLTPDASLDAVVAALLAAHQGRATGSARQPVRATTSDVPTSLTPRQLQVLRALARGLDHHHIADEFGIAPETARTHIRDLLRRMGVGSRLEAVIEGMRRRLIDLPH